MKRIISVILCMIISIFGLGINAAAQTAVSVTKPYEASFVFPDGFSVMTKSTVDDNAELLKFLGITTDTMHQYFDKKGFIAFSISQDYREQIYVIAEQNEVSSAIGNLSDIADPTTVQSLLLGDVEEEGGVVSVVKDINGEVYFNVVKEAPVRDSSDADENTKTEPCMVYYATVIDSVAYVVTYSNESGFYTEDAKAMMQSFVKEMKLTRGPQDPTVEEQNDTQIMVNWVFIALAAGILIYAVITLVSEFRKRRLEEDFKQKTPKKPLR